MTETSFRDFLRISGLSAVPEGWYRAFLADLGRECLSDLRLEEEETALVDFNRGSLFYAATVHEASGFVPLPRNTNVLCSMNGLKDIADKARDAITGEPSFMGLLERFKPVFNVRRAYNGYEVAQIGAGVLHIITTQSIEKLAEQEFALFEGEFEPRPDTTLADLENNAGLEDLNRLFNNIQWPE